MAGTPDHFPLPATGGEKKKKKVEKRFDRAEGKGDWVSQPAIAQRRWESVVSQGLAPMPHESEGGT